MSNKQRVTEIINGMGTGNASPATDAIVAEFVVIHRDELPKAWAACWGYIKAGEETEFVADVTEEVVRQIALESLAVWEFVKARDAKKSATESRRNARRDELARDIHTKAYGPMTTAPGYANSNNALQEAIDRIISLEERAA